MRLSQHFTLAEATKSATAIRLGINNSPSDDVIIRMKHVASAILEPVREHYSVPFSPTSFYRSLTLNRAIGSGDNSQHIKGEAVDFEIPGKSNYDVAMWVRDNLDFDQLILENYIIGQPSSGWVHASAKASGNRRQVLTYTRGKYIAGLVA